MEIIFIQIAASAGHAVAYTIVPIFKRYFLKFRFFVWKYNPSRLIMENNFIQIAASAGHTVAFTIGPIFKHIINCKQLYFTNGLTNIVL